MSKLLNNVWLAEIARIVVALISATIFSIITNQWLLSFVIHFSIYVFWIFIQIARFERWIKFGAHTKDAPSTSGIWSLIVEHISETHKKNRERKKSLSNLANRYQSIIKALPDATILLNENYEIVWGNKASIEILNVDLSRDIGKNIGVLLTDPMIQELLNYPDQFMEVEMVSPINLQKHLVFTKVQYGDKQTLLIARDVSQRKALQKMRKAFVANASHELRTPLTVISGYLEMLDSDEKLPSTINRLVNNAHQQAKRMDKILDDLLILSKLEEKSFSKNIGEPLDVVQMIDRLVSDLEKTSTDKLNVIESDIAPKLKVKAVESEFYSLCQNLISNAIKYSDDKTLIQISWKVAENGQACLKVVDQGEGIAPEHLERLTERFYRINVSRSRTIGGTGLGLSIVKHVMDNHGGHLKIESELGVGSSFSAYFPEYRVLNHMS
ncbi:MAG: phosphate regulon sensor histidine kinase PhoR [Kangiellaceae bacterium]